MPIDPSIPLSGQPFKMPDVAGAYENAYKLKDMYLANQAREQQMQTQAKLKDIFSTADTSTEAGQQKLVQDVMKVDPTTGFAMQKNYADLGLKKAQTSEALQKIDSQKFDMIVKKTEAANQIFATIDNAANSPLGKDPAAMNALYHSQIKSAVEQGLMSPEQLNAIPANYDANFVKSMSLQNKEHADLINKEATRRQEQQRIGLEGQRIGLEGQRLGLEAKRLSQEGWEIKQSTDPVTGEPTYTRVNKITGEQKPVEDVLGAKKGGAGGAGGREAVMNNRILSAATSAAQAITNISKLPTGSSTGLLGGYEPGHSILGVAKKAMSNVVTSQEAQTYNTMFAGVARNLAALETAGLAPAGSLTHSMEALSIKPGDTKLTIAQKLAEMKQIVHTSLEPMMAGNRLPKEQKEAMQKRLDQIDKAVPYDQESLIDYMNQKGNETLGDFGKKAKSETSKDDRPPMDSFFGK